MTVFDFEGPGVAMSMYNTDEVCLFHVIRNAKINGMLGW